LLKLPARRKKHTGKRSIGHGAADAGQEREGLAVGKGNRRVLDKVVHKVLVIFEELVALGDAEYKFC
jgi:hypothetical protein